MGMTVGPVPPRERLATLDVLRGLALCGVLVGNMVLYSGRWAGLHTSASALDPAVEWFERIFVDGKAQTLLTMLFGFGFAMQLLRAEARGEPFGGIYARRLATLFVFGSLHVLLLWWGDVTWGYAIAGVGLVPFVWASQRARVVAAVLLLFVPFVVMRADPGWMYAHVGVLVTPDEMMRSTVRLGVALQHAGHAELAAEHARYALLWSANIAAWYAPWLVGRFLLGYVAGAGRWFERDGADHLGVFRRLAAIGGAVAAVTTTVRILGWLDVVQLAAHGLAGRCASLLVDQLAMLSMALTAVGCVVLLMQRPLPRRVLGVLAPVGRMPLTTYLTQSLVATAACYGWGFGWHPGAAAAFGFALAVFAVQICIAHAWLRRFRYGPLEWLWRAGVYLAVPR